MRGARYSSRRRRCSSTWSSGCRSEPTRFVDAIERIEPRLRGELSLFDAEARSCERT